MKRRRFKLTKQPLVPAKPRTRPMVYPSGLSDYPSGPTDIPTDPLTIGSLLIEDFFPPLLSPTPQPRLSLLDHEAENASEINNTPKLYLNPQMQFNPNAQFHPKENPFVPIRSYAKEPAHYDAQWFDISPAVLQKLRRASPPFTLGRMANSDCTHDSPVTDSELLEGSNLTHLATLVQLQSLPAESFTIFDSTGVDLQIRVQFNGEVFAFDCFPGSVPIDNISEIEENIDGTQPEQLQPSLVVAASSDDDDQIAAPTIPQPKNCKKLARKGKKQSRKQILRTLTASIFEDGPCQNETSTPQTIIARVKRPIKDELPCANAPRLVTKRAKRVSFASTRSRLEVASNSQRNMSTSNSNKGSSRRDNFCWKCHQPGGDLVHCSRCSLGWHTNQCSNTVFKSKLSSMIMIPNDKTKLASRKKYENKQAWIMQLPAIRNASICIECASKEAGVHYNKKYGILKGVNLNRQKSIMKRSAALYEYAVQSLMMECKRLQNVTTGKWEEVTFESFVRIDYGRHEVKRQIDLEWIYEKTQCIYAYLCTEDFMFDIKLLCHSYLILAQKKGIAVGSPKYTSHQTMCTELISLARTEMAFVDRCDSCYRNHYEINHDRVKSDMVMPCENSHSLVWVVHRNLWWPAKVYEYRESAFFFTSEKYVNVVPFGDEEVIKCTLYKNLRKYSHNAPETSELMRATFDKSKPKTKEKNLTARKKALADAKQYMRTYWNEYFEVPYPLSQYDAPFTSKDLYVWNGGYKPGKDTLDDNFMLSSADADDDEAAKPVPVNRASQKTVKRKATPSAQSASHSVATIKPSNDNSNRSAKSRAKQSSKQKTNRRITSRN